MNSRVKYWLFTSPFLVLLSISLSACTRENVEEPNAKLDNPTLLNQATNDMRTLGSYHLELTGDLGENGVQMIGNISLQGGSNVTIDYKLRNQRQNEAQINSDASGSLVHVTDDAGKTYHTLRWEDVGDQVFGWTGAYLFLWSRTEFDPAKDLAQGGRLKDGIPQIEIIEGANTRHLVADIKEIKSLPLQRMTPNRAIISGTVDLWVSMDEHPTVRQLRITATTSETLTKGSLVDSIGLSPDGKTLGVGFQGKTGAGVKLWDINKPDSEPQIIISENSLMDGHTIFSPDWTTLASGSSGSKISIWRMDNPAAAPIILDSPDGEILAYSSDGHTLAAAGSAGIRLWDVRKPDTAPIMLSPERDILVSTLALSPDRKAVAVGDLNGVGGVVLWNLLRPEATPRRLYVEDLRNGVDSVAFSLDGKWLAAVSSSGHAVELWDPQNLEAEPTALSDGDLYGKRVAFSPDSQTLAVGSMDGTVRLWSTNTAQARGWSGTPRVLNGHSSIYSLVFSSDGHYLAVGNSDGEVLVWELNQIAIPPPKVLKKPDLSYGQNLLLTWKWSRFNEGLGR